MARKKKVDWTRRGTGRIRESETGYEISYPTGRSDGPAGCILTTEWREDIEKIRLDVSSVDDVLINIEPEHSYHPCIMLSARDREMLLKLQPERLYPQYEHDVKLLLELHQKGLVYKFRDYGYELTDAGKYLLSLPNYYK